jgi:hypothetical protein
MEKWNNQVKITNENVIVRVLEEAFGPSKSSNNPMITLQWEVVSPESINVAGVEYSIAGLKVSPTYYTTANLEDAEKSANNDKYTFGPSGDKERPSLYELFEIDTTGIDKNNPKLAFKGKLQHARISSEIKEVRKAPTAEQLKKGIKEGEIVKNPKTGKPEYTAYPKIVKLYGLADGSVSGKL